MPSLLGFDLFSFPRAVFFSTQKISSDSISSRLRSCVKQASAVFPDSFSSAVISEG